MNDKNLNFSGNLQYLAKQAKMLEKQEEYDLITDWRDNQSEDSLKKILSSYMRLAISYAKKYSNYGIQVDDLIHQGILGIMHALEKFDISKDFRLSTYASWWVRASIQDYILKNWSVVKTGSTASQKQLFFNLKKIKKQILGASHDYMGQKEIDSISKMLKIKSIEVQNMESRLTSGDVFLNQSVGDEDGNELINLLTDNSSNPEELTEKLYDNKSKNNWLKQAIESLTDREKVIIKERKLKDKSVTLDELGKTLNISKERVRQIESRALSKLKHAILEISNQQKEFFV